MMLISLMVGLIVTLPPFCFISVRDFRFVAVRSLSADLVVYIHSAVGVCSRVANVVM